MAMVATSQEDWSGAENCAAMVAPCCVAWLGGDLGRKMEGGGNVRRQLLQCSILVRSRFLRLLGWRRWFECEGEVSVPGPLYPLSMPNLVDPVDPLGPVSPARKVIDHQHCLFDGAY